MSESEGYESDQSGNSEDEEQESDVKKNVAVVVIDVGSTMFDDPKCFKKCLLAVYQIFDKLLFKSFRNNISICLLRDDEIVLTAINDNLIESAKKLIELLKKPIDDLKKEFVRDKPASLRYTLTECIKQFSNLDKINPYIVILTDDDDPHKGDNSENLSAIDVALSLKEVNIKLLVLPLIEKFGYDVFYKELIKTANDVSLDISEYDNDKSYTEVEELIDMIEYILGDKVSLRRHTFRLFDKDDKLIQFRTQIRYLVDDKELNHNVNVSSTTQNELKRQYEDQDNMDLDKLIYECDGKKLMFDKSDRLYLEMPFGFKLLWISKKKLSSFHYKRKEAFIMQKDQLTPESDKQNLFDYVWDYCNVRRVYMICGFHVPGRGQYPKLVELKPSVFESKPCFVGEFLCDKLEVDDYADLAFDDKANETKFEDDDPELGVVCDMIHKLYEEKYNPFEYTDEEYDKTAAILKTKFLDVEEETAESCFPTDAEITAKLGATDYELQEIFGEIVAPPAKKSKKMSK